MTAHTNTLAVVIVSVLLGVMVGEASAQDPPPADTKTPPADTKTPPADKPRVDPKLTPPKLKKDVKPVYPAAAKKQGIGADVVVNLELDATGKVENATIAKAAAVPNQGFDEAALAAAKQLEFEPARLGTQPVPVVMSYRFRFVPDITKVPEKTKAKPAVVPPPAPTGQLWGTLVERGTRLPIAGVKVTVFRGAGQSAEGFETETDAKGAFRFTGLGVGAWRLLANPDEYYPVRVTEIVEKDRRTSVRYRIEKRSYNEYDVVVRTKRVSREISHTSIDARQAERIPGTFGDVLAVVQNFPGVARTNAAQVVVRGSAPEDSSVYIAGIDVPILYHFGGLRSVLPVGMVERIDFYPGNFSVEYGRATGGIIDVDLKDLAPRKIGGYADVSILDTSLYLEVPVNKKLAVAVAGRRSYIDWVLGSALPSDVVTVAPRYYDAQALASYRPSPAHHLETFFFYSNDRFEILFEDPEEGASPNKIVITDFKYKLNFYRAIAAHKYVPNDRLSSELKLSVGQDNIQLSLGEDILVKLKSLQAQLRETASYKVVDKLSLRGGFDFLYARGNYTLRFPEPQDEGQAPGEIEYLFTETKANLYGAAAFAQAEYKPIESLLLVPGLRLDHFSRTEETVVSPRVTARLDLNKQWALKAGVGLFLQEPDFIETDDEVGNPNLDLEKAMHYSVGFEFRPRDHIKLEVTGFYKTLHDIVANTDAAVERAGEVVPLRLNNGTKGRVIGLEVSARHELAKGFFGWVAYTLSRAERKDEDDAGYRLFEYDQTHILTVIGSYKLPRNWEVSARFRLVSGNLYTPITGAVYSSDNDEYLPIRGATNSARVGAFNQVDFRLDKKWVYDTWILMAYLDIQNVTDRANPEGLEYNFDFTETKVTTGLPILPVLGLRGEF